MGKVRKRPGATDEQGCTVTSQGCNVISQGCNVTSQACMVTSQACMVTSQACMVTSQGCMVTSQACMVTSQACMVTSQGCNVTSQACTIEFHADSRWGANRDLSFAAPARFARIASIRPQFDFDFEFEFELLGNSWQFVANRGKSCGRTGRQGVLVQPLLSLTLPPREWFAAKGQSQHLPGRSPSGDDKIILIADTREECQGIYSSAFFVLKPLRPEDCHI